jgi:S1-C subfamily serine protease
MISRIHTDSDMKAQQDFSGRRRRRISGMTWLWIGLVVFFAIGAGLSMFVKKATNTPWANRPAAADRSYFGVDGFEPADGGLTFEVVEPAGGPADKAGLVGGDIVTSFDGHQVRSTEEIIDLLSRTQIGTMVEVVYLRDGVTRKTQLTTESEQGIERLREVGDQPKGMFGFEIDGTTRINVAETKTYGLRIDYVQPNGPADLFGIKDGDIITDFDRVPIRTGRELLSRVRRAKPRSTVEVVVLRGPEANKQTLKIPVTMGSSSR